jgi:hypothetical protein
MKDIKDRSRYKGFLLTNSKYCPIPDLTLVIFDLNLQINIDVETLLGTHHNNVLDNINNKHITIKEESVDISPIVETFNHNKLSRDSMTQRVRQKGAKELVKRMTEERNKRKRNRGITERKEKERNSMRVKQNHEKWERARDEKVGICYIRSA